MKKRMGTAMACFLFLMPGVYGSALFPEIPGWKVKEDSRVYNHTDLWQLIDGAADIFLTYGFQDLHIAEYSRKDQIIRVELYHHSSLDNAYGIYTAERMPDYTPIDVGTQGYTSEGILNFLAGRYYVKIMSSGEASAEESMIANVARKVDETLAQPVGLPPVLTLFPEDGKEYWSDTYVAENFLGYSFFHSAFVAKYNKGVEFQLFVIKATPEEIRSMLDSYAKSLKTDKLPEKDNLILANDPFNGTLFLKIKANYLVGIVNTDNETLANDYIDRVMDKIKP